LIKFNWFFIKSYSSKCWHFAYW